MLIALCGHPRVGKDTVAAHLVKHHGFVRVAFADPIRNAALAINPLVIVGNQIGRLADFVRNLGWDKCKESEMVRDLLQKIGTEAGRDIHGQYCWINLAIRKMNADRVVVTDLRFENEYDSMLDNFETTVWQIRKKGIERPNNHASEQLDYDVISDSTIDNDSSLESLFSTVDVELSKILVAANV